MATANDTVLTASGTPTPSASGSASGTDFDISKVDINSLPEEYQKIVKGYQGDYTRKTQAISEQGKEMQSKIDEAEKWIDWYGKNQQLISEFNTWRDKPKDDPDDNNDNDDGDEPLTLTDLRNLKKELKERNEQSDTAFSQGFQMLVELQALQTQSGSDVPPDPKRVIKYAQDHEITNIKDAYEGAYREEILSAKIKKAVEAEKEKWDAARKTDVLNVNMPKGREVIKVLARDRKSK